jgi:hypothetical protein
LQHDGLEAVVKTLWKHLGPGVGFGNWWQRLITMINVCFAETLVS